MSEREELKSRYASLISDYADALPSKANEISQLLNENQNAEWPKERQIELVTAVHRIAGSSGSYGFKSVSKSARALDQQLSAWFAANNKRLSAELIQDIEILIQLMKEKRN